jgi:O-antigen/teichoic acid export membrane protein
MPNSRRIVQGVATNWMAFAVSLGVAFFLAPFIVLKLGNATYGVWTLINSMASYMGLLDFGLRGAVTRFVSRDQATGNHAEASQAVSGALWIRLWLSSVIACIGVSLAVLTPALFHIPPETQNAARIALLFTSANLIVNLTCGVFGGTLAALHRFDLLSGVSICQTLLRTTGIVWLLRSGYSITGLAIWEFLVVIVANSLLIRSCFRVYPQLRLTWSKPSKEIFQNLWGYSLLNFVINICIQIVYYTDNLVVGAFLSASAVTFYAIGGSLIEYLRQLVASLTWTFTPLASNFEAQKQPQHLQRLLIQGTQASLLVALPVELALLFRGPTFIGLWMGEEYAQVSGHILQILLSAQFFAIANYTSGSIAAGLGKQGPVAVWASGEAAANLVLSILGAQSFGLEGVAWGTVIPSLAIHWFLWPRYVCQLVEMSPRMYLSQSWLRPALGAAPFALACAITDRLWVAENLLHFFLQIAAIFPIFVGGVVLCFWKEIHGWLQNYQKRQTRIVRYWERLVGGAE